VDRENRLAAQDQYLEIAKAFSMPLELVQLLASLDTEELESLYQWLGELRGRVMVGMVRSDVPEVYRLQGQVTALNHVEFLLQDVRKKLAEGGIVDAK